MEEMKLEIFHSFSPLPEQRSLLALVIEREEREREIGNGWKTHLENQLDEIISILRMKLIEKFFILIYDGIAKLSRWKLCVLAAERRNGSNENENEQQQSKARKSQNWNRYIRSSRRAEEEETTSMWFLHFQLFAFRFVIILLQWKLKLLTLTISIFSSLSEAQLLAPFLHLITARASLFFQFRKQISA